LIEKDELEIVTLKRDEIVDISLPGNSNVYIIVNGKVVLREHSMDDPFEFNII